jgi:hypothetical protein
MLREQNSNVDLETATQCLEPRALTLDLDIPTSEQQNLNFEVGILSLSRESSEELAKSITRY